MQDTVKRYFQAIKELNLEAWLACFSTTEPLEHLDPVGAPSRHTREEMAAFFTGIGGLFSEVELVPNKQYWGGDEVALTWTGRGTGKNGKAVAFEGIDVFTFDSQGLIKSIKAYWDMAPTVAVLTS